jgi:hypothetical protein
MSTIDDFFAKMNPQEVRQGWQTLLDQVNAAVESNDWQLLKKLGFTYSSYTHKSDYADLESGLSFNQKKFDDLKSGIALTDAQITAIFER